MLGVEDGAVHEGCHQAFKLRAIEASGPHGLEPLALPLFSVSVSLIAPVLVLCAVCTGKTALAFLEAGKIMIAAGIVLMTLSILHVQNLTHDCRWWGDHHHHHAQRCHQSFALFVSSTMLMGVSQAILLGRLLSRATKHERKS